MAIEGYWADPFIDRTETPLWTLFPTLDALVRSNAPVRFFDEVFSQVDWSEWEQVYERRRGQPPIHPRIVASLILYGLYCGIRSSRKLEQACLYRLDFMWLAEGRRLDHTTISKFRTRFSEPLKSLFQNLGRIAMELGLVKLGQVAFDGTRIRAYNSRFKTRTAQTLEEKLRALDELFDQCMTEYNQRDAEKAGPESPGQLPKELADIGKRREQIRAALEQARAADEARRRQGVSPDANPAQVPTTDPDSRVMPNKEGGYAPNYTPVATTDSCSGYVVDADVLNEVRETSAVVPSVERIEKTFGCRPEQFMTDAGNNTGEVMAQMEDLNVEFYAPVESNLPAPGNPALRDDPTQPVPESGWPALKRNNQGYLDKSNFVYVAQEDQYYCPQGHPMPLDKKKPGRAPGDERRVYRCAACEQCPLAAACISGQSKGGRTISRDKYEEVRERTAARMATEDARALYRQRPHLAETPFAIVKSVMGFRQFLLRGLEKVKTEWRWAITALNLGIIIRAIATLRAELVPWRACALN
jgi:transposase